MKRNSILVLLLAVLLGACAPMPGSKLFPNLEQPTPIEVVSVTIHKGFFLPTEYCLPRLPMHQQLLAFIGNFGIVPACSTVTFTEDGTEVATCEVYVMADWMIEHEMQHCKGYADSWY